MNQYLAKVAEMSDEDHKALKTFGIQTAMSIPAHAAGLAAGTAFGSNSKKLESMAGGVTKGFSRLGTKLQEAGKIGKAVGSKLGKTKFTGGSLGGLVGMGIAGGVADLAALKHGFHEKDKK